MGGVLATGLFNSDSFDHTQVSSIVTLATPHVSPAFLADPYMANYYAETQYFWNSVLLRADAPAVVSVAGGVRDLLIRSDFTQLNPLVTNSSLVVSVDVSDLAQAPISTDHLCIMWCRQVMFAVSRAAASHRRARPFILNTRFVVYRW
jgi:glycosylphosphatidylinositol deacylase